MIVYQLLKIRQHRYNKCQSALAAALNAVHRALNEKIFAEKKLHRYASTLTLRVQALYDEVIGKDITLNELEAVRLHEIQLFEHKAALESDVSTGEVLVKEKQDEAATAKQKLAGAHKELTKAEEIVAIEKRKETEVQNKREEMELDEFRTKKPALALFSSCFLLFSLSLFFSGTGWSSERAVYRAIDQNLPLLLNDVAARFNLELKSDSIPNKRVNREYAFRSLPSFLKQITQEYKLDWFIHKETLYIVPKSKRKTRTYTFASARQMEGFYHYLQNNKNKILSSPFVVKRNPDEGTIIWNAPEVYLRQLATEREFYLGGGVDRQEAAAAKKNMKLANEHKTGYGVMIFYLENAWAGDKEYKFGDGVYAVPGIATMVRSLTGAKGTRAKSQSADKKHNKNNPLIALQALATNNEGGATSATSARTPAQSSAASYQNKSAEATATVLADERLNAVLIYDQHTRYNYYKELISHLDKKAKLVEIEAMIVDVAKNHISDLGVSWRAGNKRSSAGFGAVGSSLTEGAIGLSLGVGGLPTALAGSLKGILAKIRLLETKGNSRIVSRPSVMTMDNLEAVINTTQRFYVKVSGFQDSSLYPVETGTTLKVTPHVITKKNPQEPPSIRLFITIEDGAVDRSESAAVDSIPTIQENKVKTQAVVEQGESLLIGGHIHTTTSESISRVPILGQIPGLGWLFSTKNKTNKEFIRLFIIRPRVYR